MGWGIVVLLLEKGEDLVEVLVQEEVGGCEGGGTVDADISG